MIRTALAARAAGGAAALLALVAMPAHAHVAGTTHAHAVGHGVLHPLVGLDHLLAMVAVGLWAAQRGGRAIWLLPVAFVVAMLGGATVGAAGIAMPGVEQGILLSVLLLGALVASAVRVPTAIGVAVVAAFALLHGHAHGTEMPANASGLAYGAGFAVATAGLHAVGVIAALGLRRGAVGTAALRLAGAAIGIGGVALASM